MKELTKEPPSISRHFRLTREECLVDARLSSRRLAVQPPIQTWCGEAVVRWAEREGRGSEKE